MTVVPDPGIRCTTGTAIIKVPIHSRRRHSRIEIAGEHIVMYDIVAPVGSVDHLVNGSGSTDSVLGDAVLYLVVVDLAVLGILN